MRDEDAPQKKLERACVIAQLLLDEAGVRTAVDVTGGAHRRSIARDLLEDDDIALAVLEGPSHMPTFTNAAWRELFGPEAKHQPGGGVSDVVARVEDVLRTQKSIVHIEDDELRTPKFAFCRTALAPLRGERGELAGLIVACLDTTEERIARVLSVPLGSVMLIGEPDGNFERANRAWYAWVGERQIACWLDFIHPDDRDRCVATMRESTRNCTVVATAARLRQSDDAYRLHEMRFAGIAGESRAFAAAIAPRDRRAETVETRFSFRTRRNSDAPGAVEDRFLAAVSHELRAPLTTMLLWEKVLRDETADDELRKHALDAIHQSVLMQSRLVGDLLDVTRASNGKLHVDLQPVELMPLLAEAVDAIMPAMLAKQLVVELALAPTVCLVEGDGTRLRQVFDNLLSNALKFTDAGGRVCVATKRLDQAIAIEVSDSGRGISDEFLPYVFEPFSQLDDALTRSAGGLGLGLAIARELVTLHHGKIEAASAGTGRGTTFTVTLPVLAPHRTPTPPPRRRRVPLVGTRLLVIDDDPRVRAALTVLLRRAGADVECVDSAEAARVAFDGPRFDVVICDIAMPREDGYAFLRGLRATQNATPAIALTAHATPADARRARDAGFDLHVAKPVDFEHLVASVHAAIAARDPRGHDT